MRWLAYRRMHALIHNLVTVAALVDRLPVIPRVPCAFIRATQQRVAPSKRSRFGVSHPSVVATGTKEEPMCNLAPGTWRPGGPGQCYHDRMMSQFDYEHFAKQPYFTKAVREPLPRLAVPNFTLGPPAGVPYDNAEISIERLAQMCREAGERPDSLVLELDGLLPIRDYLIDSPIGVSEFDSEALRLKSGRPRWHSLIQGPELAKLKRDCPGAAKFLMQRKACVGFFLAE